MDHEIIWLNEGSVLTDGGHLIVTSYVDLRKPADRTPIRSLIRGCERRFALERCGTIMISMPPRYQEHGENLILDRQEGAAKDESITQAPSTEAQEARQKSIAELNEAIEILDAGFRAQHKETHTNTNTSRRDFTYGDSWWIFCTSIKPEDRDLERWRNSLPTNYDHASEIGQPAMFAQSLARMVTDQIGPQCKEGTMRDGSVPSIGVKARHPF